MFLLGGLTQATKPMALFLHSGDVCVMTGDSRLAYHAVPRIHLTEREVFHTEFNNKEVFHIDRANTQGQEEAQTLKDSDFDLYQKYMSKCRVNVNIRQVLKHGQNFPLRDDDSDEVRKF